MKDAIFVLESAPKNKSICWDTAATGSAALICWVKPPPAWRWMNLLANKSSSSSNRSSGVRGDEGAAKKAVCKTRFSSLLGPMDSKTEKGFLFYAKTLCGPVRGSFGGVHFLNGMSDFMNDFGR